MQRGKRQGQQHACKVLLCCLSLQCNSWDGSLVKSVAE